MKAKVITTKQHMTRVANIIEKRLREELGYFSYIAFDRDNGDNFVVIEVSQKDRYCLTMPVVEEAQKVLRYFVSKYPTCVFPIFDTVPVKATESGDFLHAPTLNVTIRKRE